MSDSTDALVWQFRNLTHAQQPREPTRYVLDKFLASHTLNIVFGAPGSLKSMIVLDAALSIAGGSEWLQGGNGGFAVEQSPVLWVDLDNGERRTDERVDAISKGKQTPADSPFYYLSMPNPPLIATDIESMAMLRDAIEESGAGTVVIDNLGLVTGPTEENSAAMGQVMANFRWLSENTGAAIILIHHQRKGGAGAGRSGDGLRGHSSIEAAIDLALHVTRDEDSGQIAIKSTKTRGVDVPTIAASFYYEHVPGTNDLQRAWFETVGAERVQLTIAESVIFYLTESGPMVKARLVDRVFHSMSGAATATSIRAEIDNMLATSGEIVEVDGRNKQRVIELGIR